MTNAAAELMQNIANDLVEAEELRQRVGELEAIENAARYACITYMHREERPDEYWKAMRTLYMALRKDLTEEEKAEL